MSSLVELDAEKGETFLQELLVNGWLSRLISIHGHVEESITKWTFNLMLYSSKEETRMSAYDFWCTIFSPENKAEKQGIRIEWFPSYTELKGALETYGFLFNCSSHTKSVDIDSNDRGPPENVRDWIKFTAACCRVRIFSASEAEELLQFVICLCLDHQLQGLLVLLNESMISTISYFTDEECSTSCERIARTLACRVPRDMNCLRTVQCISAVGFRSGHLRSAVSYQILFNKAADEEGILNILISINVKDKSCDFFNMYIYLVLTENWLV